jgi:hypothetical protein
MLLLVNGLSAAGTIEGNEDAILAALTEALRTSIVKRVQAIPARRSAQENRFANTSVGDPSSTGTAPAPESELLSPCGALASPSSSTQPRRSRVRGDWREPSDRSTPRQPR